MVEISHRPSTPKVEAAYSSERLVPMYQTSRPGTSEELNITRFQKKLHVCLRNRSQNIPILMFFSQDTIYCLNYVIYRNEYFIF
jgi:hypothetical protein